MLGLENLEVAKNSLKKAREDAKKAVAEVQEKAKLVMEKVFKESVGFLFAENAGLKVFSFACYTPFWCDGGPCNYYAHIDEPAINPREEDDSDTFGYYANDDPRNSMQRNVVKFLRNFDDDDYETMFGDHCKVTVTADSIKVEGYDHE
jgi:hypothetical protein